VWFNHHCLIDTWLKCNPAKDHLTDKHDIVFAGGRFACHVTRPEVTPWEAPSRSIMYHYHTVKGEPLTTVLSEQIGLRLQEPLVVLSNANNQTPSIVSKLNWQLHSRENPWNVRSGNNGIFPHQRIYIGQRQQEMAVVSIFTTPYLDLIGQSLETYIVVCLPIVVPIILMTVKDIIV